MTWFGILACAAGCYALKLAGLSVPPGVLRRPLVQRIADLLPVALLAALVAVQVFATDDRGLAVDARLAGLPRPWSPWSCGRRSWWSCWSPR